MRQRRWSTTPRLPACSARRRGERHRGPGEGQHLPLAALAASSAAATGLLLALSSLPASAAEGPVFTDAPAALTSQPVLSWGGTVPEGAVAECELTSPAGSAPVDCAGPGASFAVSTTATADGGWTLTVWALADDGTGTLVRSAPDSRTTLVDTAPPAVGITTSPPSPSADRAPAWTLTLEPGATGSCTLSGPGVVLGPTACASSYTAPLASAPAGSYQLEVTAVDAAGNGASVRSAEHVLLAPPAAPTVSAPVSPGTASEVAWTFPVPMGATARCVLTGPDGLVLQDVPGCGSPWATVLTAGDGLYTVSVTLTDAGGTSEPGTAGYALDTTTPAAPVVTSAPTSPSDSGVERRFTWNFSTEELTHCRVLSGPAVVQDWVVCASTYTLDTAGLPDGSYTLELQSQDAAGNVTDVVRSLVVLDTTAPEAPVVAGSAGRTADPALSWAFDSTDATALCRVEANGAPGLETPCTSPVTVTAPVDGSYRLVVVLVDAAGNRSAAGTGPWVEVDRTAPDTPVIETAPTSPGSGPRFTWNLSSSETTTCSIVSDATVVVGWTACSTSFSLDTTDLPDGIYTLNVRSADDLGNTSPAASSSVVLDATAPAVPLVTASAGPSSSRSWTVSFVGEDGTTAHCLLWRGDAVVQEVVACTSPVLLELTGEPDGRYTVTVVLVDAAGNRSAVGSAGYLLDTTPPAPPVLSGPGSPGNDTTPTWGVSAEGTVECRLLGPAGVVTDWIGCDTGLAADLNGLPNGGYTLEARASDAAGNVSEVATAAYLLDTSPPPAAGVTAPESPSSSATPVWAVVATEDGAWVSCRVVRDGAVVLDWAPCAATTGGSPVGVDLGGLPDGTYRLEVRLTDAAGNDGPTAGADYVLDTTAPDAVTVAAPASPGNDLAPTWRVAGELGARLECRIGDSGAFEPCAPDGSLQLALSAGGDGTYAVWFRAVDAAGNVGPATRSSYTLDTRPPSAPQVLAPAGPAADPRPVWSWTGEDGTTALCALTRDGVEVSSGACSAPWTPVLGADGGYALTVTLLDAAGNASTPSTATYVLDTTPPELPTVFGPSSPNSLADPRFGVRAEAGARVECRRLVRVGGAFRVDDDWQTCTVPVAWDLVTEGIYRLEVRVVDAAGNVSPVAARLYAYDRDAASGLTGLTVPASPGTSRLPTWAFDAPAGTTTTCRLTDERDVVLYDGPCVGSFQPVAPLGPDGGYTLRISVRDDLGNQGTYDAFYLLDTTGPDAPLVTPADLLGTDRTVAWGWTSDPTAAGSRCRLLRDGALVLDWHACEAFRLDLVPHGEGRFELEVRDVDELGNLGQSGRGSYRWDVTAPAALGLTSTAGSSGATRQVIWQLGVPSDAVTVTCSVRRGGAVVHRATGCGSGVFLMDLTGLPEARYDLVVRFTDAAGNVREQVGSYLLSSVVTRPQPAPETGPRGPAAPSTDRSPTPVRGRVVPLSPAVETALPAATTVRAADQASRVARGTVPGTAVDISDEAAEEEPAPVLGLPGGPISGARAVEALKDVAGETIRRPQLPIALLLVVALFLLVQNRIDGRDPKLAGADVDEEPELEFRPFGRVVPMPGGATT